MRLLLWEGVALASRFYRAFGHLEERGPADGPPLMVVPGFLATDRTTLGLQRALAEMKKDDRVWFATGSVIIDAYEKANPVG